LLLAPVEAGVGRNWVRASAIRVRGLFSWRAPEATDLGAGKTPKLERLELLRCSGEREGDADTARPALLARVDGALLDRLRIGGASVPEDTRSASMDEPVADCDGVD
jgi:hypothetical protein